MINKTFILLLVIACSLLGQSKDNSISRTTHFSVGSQFGLSNGLGAQINFVTSNFADNFPFSAKIGVGISFKDPGDPLAARRIFINNNTNGIPEESGRSWNFNLDLLYKTSFLGIKRNYLYAGPRYVLFTGNFNFIGGNEDFDVTSDQWGIGAGLENYFRIVPALDLVINFGFDYYFTEALHGHDTSYSPDEQNINPREDYSYSDADKAIEQPKYQIKALVGFNYNLN